MNNTNPNLSIKVIYSIINFQRQFRVNLESIRNLNKKVSILDKLKDIDKPMDLLII